jgi:DNA (cytosine-5)-methyltransferase 1
MKYVQDNIAPHNASTSAETLAGAADSRGAPAAAPQAIVIRDSGGDMTAGLQALGFTVPVACEDYRPAAREYQDNHHVGQVIHEPVKTLDATVLPKSAVLVTTADSRSGTPERTRSPMQPLTDAFMLFLQLYATHKCEILVACGQKKILAPSNRPLLRRLKREAAQHGLALHVVRVEGADYGPHTQTRVALIVAPADRALPDHIRPVAATKAGDLPLPLILPEPDTPTATLREVLDAQAAEDLYHDETTTQMYLSRATAGTTKLVEEAVQATKADGSTVFLCGYNAGRAFRTYPSPAQCPPITGPAGGSSRMVVLEIRNGRVRSRKLSASELNRLGGRPEDHVAPSWSQNYRSICEGTVRPIFTDVLKHVVLPLLGRGPAPDDAPENGTGTEASKSDRRGTTSSDRHKAGPKRAHALATCARLSAWQQVDVLLGRTGRADNDNRYVAAPPVPQTVANSGVGAAAAALHAQPFALLRFTGIASPIAMWEGFCGVGDAHAAAMQAEAQWTCTGAVDTDAAKGKAYVERHGEAIFVVRDICEIEAKDIPKSTEALWTSPPCHTWSSAGKKTGRDDVRGQLIFEPIRLMRDLKEAGRALRVVIIENVDRLLQGKNRDTAAALLRAGIDCGYVGSAMIVNADKWTPQNRRRAFIVFIRNDHVLPAGVTGAPNRHWHNSAVRKTYDSLPVDYQKSFVWLQMPLPRTPRPTLLSILDTDVPGRNWRTKAWIKKEIEPNLKGLSKARYAALREQSRTKHCVIVRPLARRGRGPEVTAFKDKALCLSGQGGGSSKQMILVFDNGTVRAREFTSGELNRLMMRERIVEPATYDLTYKAACEGLIVAVITHLFDHIVTPIVLRNRVMEALRREATGDRRGLIGRRKSA